MVGVPVITETIIGTMVPKDMATVVPTVGEAGGRDRALVKRMEKSGIFPAQNMGQNAGRKNYRPYFPVIVAVPRILPSKAFLKAESDTFVPRSSFSTFKA